MESTNSSQCAITFFSRDEIVHLEMSCCFALRNFSALFVLPSRQQHERGDTSRAQESLNLYLVPAFYFEARKSLVGPDPRCSRIRIRILVFPKITEEFLYFFVGSYIEKNPKLLQICRKISIELFFRTQDIGKT